MLLFFGGNNGRFLSVPFVYLSMFVYIYVFISTVDASLFLFDLMSLLMTLNYTRSAVLTLFEYFPLSFCWYRAIGFRESEEEPGSLFIRSPSPHLRAVQEMIQKAMRRQNIPFPGNSNFERCDRMCLLSFHLSVLLYTHHHIVMMGFPCHLCAVVNSTYIATIYIFKHVSILKSLIKTSVVFFPPHLCECTLFM